jgi:23S rRNA (adenine2503-C2)-methyltransferase
MGWLPSRRWRIVMPDCTSVMRVKAGQVSLANELLRVDPVRDERPDGSSSEDDPDEPPPHPDRPVTNIVYMGMGEPLHNDAGTFASLAILTDDAGMHYSARRITVSTVGLVPRMLELGEKYPVVLAVSLHAADDELRGRIMPVNKRYDLAAVLDACRAFPRKSRERITFEYALLSGVNDRKEDAERLIALLGDLRCKVNLIPFNEHEGAPFTRPDDRHVTRFDRWLRDGGVPTFVRRTRGRDIAAACGQLALGERKRGAVVADQAGPTD